jgi:DNA replication protein DnaC
MRENEDRILIPISIGTKQNSRPGRVRLRSARRRSLTLLASILSADEVFGTHREAIFKDPMTTAAAIDRLVHHCVIVELNIPSYRAEQAKKAKQGRSATAEAGET